MEAEDALAWATSLSEARRSPHLAALVSGEAESTSSAHQRSARGTTAVETFLPVMDEFIEYAFGGAFSFARTDEELPEHGPATLCTDELAQILIQPGCMRQHQAMRRAFVNPGLRIRQQPRRFVSSDVERRRYVAIAMDNATSTA